MITQLISLSVLNLMRARTRMLMTAGGILVATTGIIMLIAFTIGLQDAAEAGLGSNSALTQILVTTNGGSNDPQLTTASIQKMSHISGVKVVIPLVNLLGNQLVAAGNSTSRIVLGIDPTLLPYLGLPVQTGKLAISTGQAISGSDVGNNFPSINRQTLQTESTTIDIMTVPVKLTLSQTNKAPPATRDVPLKVVGLLKQGSDYDSDLFIPVTDAISLNEWITGVKVDPRKFAYDEVIVRSESREVTNKAAQSIQRLGFATKSLGDLLDQMNDFFSTMHLVLGGIGMITLLVAASGVANTMMMATRERIKEIGLMKAIGGTDEDILTIFLLEAGLIGLTGSLGGVGLSFLLQDLINRWIQNLAASQNAPSFLSINLSSLTTPIIIPANLALFAIGLAVFVSVGAGLYPAIWAARLPPVIALKQE